MLYYDCRNGVLKAMATLRTARVGRPHGGGLGRLRLQGPLKRTALDSQDCPVKVLTRATSSSSSTDS